MRQQAGGDRTTIRPPVLGVYIHFPFCQRKCRYCDFYSEDAGLERSIHWLKALQIEIELRSSAGNSLPAIETIYLGGGSPNLLQPEQLDMIVQTLNKCCDCHALTEFTMELNPNHLTPVLVQQMKRVGVNRVSLGFQSLQEEELRVLGRLHTVADCFKAYTELQARGFSNISLDLIYGIPGQTLTSWQASLRRALELKPQHLSLYNLTYEEGTPLTRALQKGEISALDEGLEWQMYAWATATLNDYGYEHYEISNWAQPGFRSHHNQSYWSRHPYVGFGPSAHSFFGEQRCWNVKSIDQYTFQLDKGQLPIEGSEQISAEKRNLEMLMLALRTRDGITLEELVTICQDSIERIVTRLMHRLGDQLETLVVIEPERLRLTTRGWFLYNALLEIFLDFIKEEDNGN